MIPEVLKLLKFDCIQLWSNSGFPSISRRWTAFPDVCRSGNKAALDNICSTVDARFAVLRTEKVPNKGVRVDII